MAFSFFTGYTNARAPLRFNGRLAGLLIVLLLSYGFMPRHDFHVSTTDIEYMADREQVQIVMHLFIDDLELALQRAGAPKLLIGTPNELPQTGQHLSNYLEKNFRLYWNGDYLPTGMLGYEMSDDMQALWVYLQANTAMDMKSIEVQNSVLTEIYEDQKNIVKVTSAQAKKRATFLLSKDRTLGKQHF